MPSSSLSPKQLATNSNVLLPVSPVGSGFVPRVEFRPDTPLPSTYSLLAIAHNNSIRLTNFPDHVVRHLNAFFDARKLLRELKLSPEHKLAKFILVGKPWASTKSVETEALLVELLSVILAEGYHFLSAVDYAKEVGDTLSLIFSRPIAIPDRVSTYVPFGISFVSGTVMRVVNVPLGRAPGILRSVREAWPRGVVSERKVGRAVYEFKLKGYGLFEEDTFYEDSCDNIFTLLSSLSLHGFNLLTSLSLTPGKSGVKDFWIFVGTDVPSAPGMHENLSAPDMPSFSTESPSARSRNASLDGYPSDSSRSRFVPGHARNATAPAIVSPYPPYPPYPPSEPSDASLLRGLQHAFSEPTPSPRSHRVGAGAAPRSPRSPLAQLCTLPDESYPYPPATDADFDAIDWEDSSPEVPPLAHTASPDGSISPPSARLATPPEQSVHVEMGAPNTLSHYAPIEETPDIRATQILYATPPPPRPVLAKDVESEGNVLPGGPAPA